MSKVTFFLKDEDSEIPHPDVIKEFLNYPKPLKLYYKIVYVGQDDWDEFCNVNKIDVNSYVFFEDNAKVRKELQNSGYVGNAYLFKGNDIMNEVAFDPPVKHAYGLYKDSDCQLYVREGTKGAIPAHVCIEKHSLEKSLDKKKKPARKPARKKSGRRHK